MFNFFKKATEASNDNYADISDYLGISQVWQMNEMLQAKSFDEANDLYQQSPWFLQSLLAEGSGLDANNFKPISEWYMKQPENFVACLMWGVALTGKAWRVRGAGIGTSVTENAGENFLSLLNEALQAIDKSDRLNDEHPETCVRAIRACGSRYR